MIRFIASCVLIFNLSISSAFAQEMWLCDGWLATGDGSRMEPFLMRGGREGYFWEEQITDTWREKEQTKFVAENTVFKFLIHVDDTSNTNKNAYYIQIERDILTMVSFKWDMRRFVTTCRRQ